MKYCFYVMFIMLMLFSSCTYVSKNIPHEYIEEITNYTVISEHKITINDWCHIKNPEGGTIEISASYTEEKIIPHDSFRPRCTPRLGGFDEFVNYLTQSGQVLDNEITKVNSGYSYGWVSSKNGGDITTHLLIDHSSKTILIKVLYFDSLPSIEQWKDSN